MTHSQLNTSISDSSDSEMQAKLKDWGLLPTPECLVRFTTDDGKQNELYLGRKVAFSTLVYARCSGKKNEEVKYVDANLKTVVDKDLDSFRSKSVFDFDINQVVRFAAQIPPDSTHPAQDYSVDTDSKDGKVAGSDKKWTLKKPLVTRADSSAVMSSLNQLQTLRVIAFVTDTASNPSTYGLTTPAEVFTISTTIDGKTEDLTFQIGGPVPGKADQLYAQRGQTTSVFTVNKAAVEGVIGSLGSLRDRHILPIRTTNFTALSYDYNGKKAALERGKSTWSLAGKPLAVADSFKVIDAADRISRLQSTPLIKDSPPDLKVFGLDKPLGKIVLTSTDFNPSDTLTINIGKTENKVTYVKTSIDSCVYAIGDGELGFLPPNNDSFRSVEVLSLDNKNVKSLIFKRAQRNEVQIFRTEGATWTAPAFKNLMVDSGKAEQQASLICHIRAKSWLGDPTPADGLDKPDLTITINQDKLSPIKLIIGAKLADGSHAAEIEGANDVFGLDEGDYGILTTGCLQPIPTVLLTPTPNPTVTANPTPTGAPTGSAKPTSAPIPSAKPTVKPDKSAK